MLPCVDVIALHCRSVLLHGVAWRGSVHGLRLVRVEWLWQLQTDIALAIGSMKWFGLFLGAYSS